MYPRLSENAIRASGKKRFMTGSMPDAQDSDHGRASRKSHVSSLIFV